MYIRRMYQIMFVYEIGEGMPICGHGVFDAIKLCRDAEIWHVWHKWYPCTVRRKMNSQVSQQNEILDLDSG